MANNNVRFFKGDTEFINSVPIKDGQVLFNTEEKILFLDEGTERKEYSSYDRISQLQGNIASLISAQLNALRKELYYQDGDTFAPLRAIATSGYLTSSSKAIMVGLTLPKSMANVDTLTLNALKLTIRHADGGYVMNAKDVLADSAYTVSCYKTCDNNMMINITASTAFSFTNNAPLSVSVDAISVSFSATSTTNEEGE